MSNTPRYILSTALVSDAPQYEFPMQALNRNKPQATLVVESVQGFNMALVNALAWAETYSAKQHLPVYPRVRYGDGLRMIKKVVGAHAWAENGSHGAWVPVGALSL